MKKLLLLFIAPLLLVSCGDDDEPKQKIWDPNATVLIKPDKTAFPKTKATENTEHLSALEIVKQGDYLEFIATYSDNEPIEPVSARRGFSENQKDYTIPALKMWGTDIIDQEGIFVKDFIYAYDMVVINTNKDTIAYIPNKVLQDVRKPLEKAYNEKRYEDVYKMFDDAFTFRPITHKEWEELKKQGKQ